MEADPVAVAEIALTRERAKRGTHLCGRIQDAVSVGIGLRGPHIDEVARTRPSVAWLEVHPENYIGDGPALEKLRRIRRDYPISLHGVGLSIGSAAGLDHEHLRCICGLARDIDPFLVSEHLAWSMADGIYLNDLLPLPYTEEALGIVAANVDAVQETLGRTILLENPSAYLRFSHSTISEPAFLHELARRTGCQILCDVNNVFVSCANLNQDARQYLDDMPAECVAEIHLAGHSRIERAGGAILIDDHSCCVAPAVLDLYRYALQRFGAVPTLVEWDTRIPELPVLLAEGARVAAAARSAVAVDQGFRL